MFLEHVNVSVKDLDRSVAFYRDLLGLRVRWSGIQSAGRRGAHVGDDKHYLALVEVGADAPDAVYDRTLTGTNHIGWVVDDLEAAKRKLQAMGIKPHQEDDYEPGARLYFFDPNGVEIELVEYQS